MHGWAAFTSLCFDRSVGKFKAKKGKHKTGALVCVRVRFMFKRRWHGWLGCAAAAKCVHRASLSRLHPKRGRLFLFLSWMRNKSIQALSQFEPAFLFSSRSPRKKRADENFLDAFWLVPCIGKERERERPEPYVHPSIESSFNLNSLRRSLSWKNRDIFSKTRRMIKIRVSGISTYCFEKQLKDCQGTVRKTRRRDTRP